MSWQVVMIRLCVDPRLHYVLQPRGANVKVEINREKCISLAESLILAAKSNMPQCYLLGVCVCVCVCVCVVLVSEP